MCKRMSCFQGQRNLLGHSIWCILLGVIKAFFQMKTRITHLKLNFKMTQLRIFLAMKKIRLPCKIIIIIFQDTHQRKINLHNMMIIMGLIIMIRQQIFNHPRSYCKIINLFIGKEQCIDPQTQQYLMTENLKLILIQDKIEEVPVL